MQQKLSVSVMQLMEETLGLSVDVLDGTGGTSVYENVATGTVDANLEVWRGLKDRSLACTSTCGARCGGTCRSRKCSIVPPPR